MNTPYERAYVKISETNCLAGSCPAIYAVTKKDKCMAGGCPTIQEATTGYLVVGRLLSPEEIQEAGLAEKVAEAESVVEIPKSLLERLAKDLSSKKTVQP